jgi:hypothetical protein
MSLVDQQNVYSIDEVSMKCFSLSPWSLLLPLLLCSCATHQKIHKASLDDLKVELAADEADYSQPPKELVIEVTGEPRWNGSYLIVAGKLINPTDQPIEYYGHDYPIPLHLELSEDAPVGRRWKKPQRNSQRPQAVRVTVPAHSFIMIEGGMDLMQYEYTGEPVVQVNWQWQYWSGDRPEGKFSAKLPLINEEQSLMKVTNSMR